MDHKELNLPFEVKNVDEDGTIEGYGSVFGNVDLGDDVVMQGCFAQSLTDHRLKNTMPAMLWHHDQREPIGRWTDMKEDDRGLRCRGKLLTTVSAGREAHERAKAGVVNGLSIGFMPYRDGSEFRTEGGKMVRYLKSVRLFEVSMVTLPMNESARITAVKGIEDIDNLKTLADCERFLREAGIVTRSQAAAFVSRIKRLAQSESDATGLKESAARLVDAANSLRRSL